MWVDLTPGQIRALIGEAASPTNLDFEPCGYAGLFVCVEILPHTRTLIDRPACTPFVRG